MRRRRSANGPDWRTETITRSTAKLVADGCIGTDKVLSDRPDTAQVVAHAHEGGTFLCRQMGIVIGIADALQYSCLHLVLVAANSVSNAQLQALRLPGNVCHDASIIGASGER